MIIVKVIGGLGNQMFQYALGFSLARRNNAILKIDTSDFSRYKLHRFCLNTFNIHSKIATAKEIEKNNNSLFSSLINNLFSKAGLPKPIKNSKCIKEKNFNFDSNILKLRGNYYLDGYWQSEKYFIEYKKLINEEFQIKSPPDEKNLKLLQKIRNCESVAIHVRHGDYLTNQSTNAFHGVLPLDYYSHAINIITQHVSNPVFFIFSDDPEWVKQNFTKQIPIVIVDHNKANKNYEDLRLMSSCQHQIIANSTFSWWAAWLNANSSKIVIAPEKWFSQADIDTRDLIPKTWHRI